MKTKDFIHSVTCTFYCRHIAVLKVHDCNTWEGRVLARQCQIKGLKDICALTFYIVLLSLSLSQHFMTDALQIGISFLLCDRSLVILFFFTFLIHTLVFIIAFSSSFSHFLFATFFVLFIRNPRSFIYFPLRLLSSNRPCAVRISVKYHPCEMGCAAASFSRNSRIRCNIAWLCSACADRLTDEKLRMWDERKSE